MQSSDSTLYSLQAARGIAACLVLLFHQTIIFQLPKYWGASPIGSIFIHGDVGVHFFFVLSGFIIAYAHHRDIGHPERLVRYAERRLTRLLPIYWLLTLLVLPAYVAFNSDLASHVASKVVASIFLVPLAGHDADGAVLDVAWTLFYEAAFYVLFGILIFRRQLGAAVIVLWLLAILFYWRSDAAFYLLDPFNLLFFLGLATFTAYKYVRIPFPLPIAIAGVLVMMVGASEVDRSKAETVLIGLGAALIVLGLAEAERSRPSTVPRLLAALGGASYAIYLIHYPMLSVMAKLAFYTGLSQWPLVSFVLMTVVVLVAGLSAHFVLERPLIEWARSRWRANIPMRAAT